MGTFTKMRLNCTCRSPLITLIAERWEGDVLVRIFDCKCSEFPTLFDEVA